MALDTAGMGPATIARNVGVTRQTIWRWVRIGAFAARSPQAPRTRMAACCRLGRARDAAAFPPWRQSAPCSGLPEMREVARVLERDRAAVENALRYAWSNGVTEGHINNLKLLKRSMDGRANFDLLRRRLVHAA